MPTTKRLLTDETGQAIADELKRVVAVSSKVSGGHTISLLGTDRTPMYIFACVPNGVLFDVSPYPTKPTEYQEATQYVSGKSYYYLDNGTYVEDTNVVDSSSFESEQTLHTKLYIRVVYTFRGWATNPLDEETIAKFPMFMPTEDTELFPIFTTRDSCYITNLGSENLANVQFSKSANFVNENNAWEEIDINGNKFAKFPTYYRKTLKDSNGNLIGFEISNAKENDDFEPYSCFLDENGNVLPYILIGRYQLTSTSQASSVDGTRATMTIGTGRQLCAALGAGYQQMDASMFCFWRDLALAISQRVDFNSGQGVSEYLGLKMLNSGFWLDGIAHNSEHIYFSNKPSKYIDQPTASSDGYSELGYTLATSSNYIKQLGVDDNHKDINFPKEVGGTASTYYCDYLYYSSGNRPLYCSVGGTNAYYGLFYAHAYSVWSSAYGVRLCFKPSIS